MRPDEHIAVAERILTRHDLTTNMVQQAIAHGILAIAQNLSKRETTVIPRDVR